LFEAQKTEDRRQKTEGRRQKTEGRRQKTDCESSVVRPMAERDPPKADRSKRILILGLGNILLRDEGVGSHVAQLLLMGPRVKHGAKYLAGGFTAGLPADVEVVDGGTAALDALLLAQDIDRLVVIDALRAGQKPGTIYRAKFQAGEKGKLAEILAGQGGSRISLHQVGLIEALAVAEKLNSVPEEIVIIGVEPGKVDWGLELTEQVAQKLPEIINTVVKEIEDAVHRK